MSWQAVPRCKKYPISSSVMACSPKSWTVLDTSTESSSTESLESQRIAWKLGRKCLQHLGSQNRETFYLALASGSMTRPGVGNAASYIRGVQKWSRSDPLPSHHTQNSLFAFAKVNRFSVRNQNITVQNTNRIPWKMIWVPSQKHERLDRKSLNKPLYCTLPWQLIDPGFPLISLNTGLFW